MTFSYTAPPVQPSDQVRFWSGDTVSKPYSVSNEEIGFLLNELDQNVMAAAAVVADRIADYWSATASTGGNKTVGPFSAPTPDSAQLEATWRARAVRLRNGGPGAGLFAGGSLFTGSATPEFTVGMFDNGPQGARARESGAPNGVW